MDERIGVRISVKHPVLAWMSEYVSYLMNRLEVPKDGRTADGRVKGKRAQVMGIEFGEKALWKSPPGRRMEKLNLRWGHGRFEPGATSS